jgi:PKD repeat protein
MIAPARSLPFSPAPSRHSVGRGGRLMALVGLVALLASAACDKVPLTAPTGSTVTLFSNTTIVPVNGAAEITATVIESGGTLVQNGTLVTFTTTIGQIEPAEARTRDGKVTVRLVAGTRSGRAVVRAFSGGTTSGDLTVDIGGAAAGSINLTANPSVVPSTGGTSALLAVVFDVDGNRLPGVHVSFTTTAGTLSSTVVLTNQQGEATTTITTNRDADVTASAGGSGGGSGGSGGGEGGGGGGSSAAITQTVKITAAAVPTVTISSTTSNPTADSPIVFTIAASATAPATVRQITVDFGDGTIRPLGNTTSVTHTYRNSGPYTVTATVEDSNGARNTGSTVIVVSPAVQPLITLTATPQTATANSVITFRVEISQNPGNIPVESVSFTFGDGNGRPPGQSLTTSHIYSTPNVYSATATVRFNNGRTATAETAVRIN